MPRWEEVYTRWAGLPERCLSMDQLQGGAIVLMPSYVLEQSRAHRGSGPPPLSFLLKYGDDVIQEDYKGIIKWGITRRATFSSMQDVLVVLSAWHSRMETSVRDEFEKEMLSRVKRDGVGWTELNCIIQTFPSIEHDMIHLDLNTGSTIDDVLEDEGELRQFYHEDYKDWLMEVYNFEDKEDPSFPFVILRSFLQSCYMSKHADDKRLGKDQLENLGKWLWVMNRDDPDKFRSEKAVLLFELLQTVKLESSQLLETSEPVRITSGRSSIIRESRYKLDHSWREILEQLSEGADQQNENGQLPLHQLLINGLPGQDILVNANKAAVDTICQVEEMKMYPFQLAARERNYDTVVAEDESLRKSLDREQLSQIYSLVREVPAVFHFSSELEGSEYDEAYSKSAKECFSYFQRLNRKKAKKEKIKRELEEFEKKMKRKLEEIDQEIELDSEHLAKKRRTTEEMPKWKAAGPKAS